jgi:branched-chain amino acid transport system permease protein
MDQFLVSLMNGVVYGLLLFMVSAGLTLIFGMMGVLNFAHASFYMLGAYFAYTLQGAIGFWAAIVVSPILVGWWAWGWSASSCGASTSTATRTNCC